MPAVTGYVCQTSSAVKDKMGAPILSFTAEEVWQTYPVTAGKEESVFLEEIEHFGDIASEVSFQDWETILEIRDLVNQTIEASIV